MGSLQDLVDDLRDTKLLTPAERLAAAKSLTEKCGYAAAALTILPIPFSETVAVVPVHIAMVTGIGRIYGADVTRESARKLVLKIAGTLGLSLVGSRLALGAAKTFFPIVAGIMGAPFMYASTLAIGTVVRVYYENEGKLDDDEMRRVYRESLREAKKGYDPKKAKAGDAQDLARAAASEAKDAPPPEPEPSDPLDRLEKLKRLLDAGVIDQPEFDEAKKKILAQL